MKFPWFSPTLRSSSRSNPPRAHRARPERTIECLEERIVLATVFVVPIAQALDPTHRYSLGDALTLAGAGGTVIIEPGATPEANTVNVSVGDVTIQGDPGVFAGSLPRYDLSINASQVTLSNLNLGDVTVAATADHATINRSQLVSFTELGATNGVGHNTLSHNVITGFVDLQGNSGVGQVTADLLADNQFFSAQSIVVKLTNSNLTSIQDNHIIASGSSAVGIQVRSNSDGVSITGNTMEMKGAGIPFAVVLINTGGAAGNIVAAKVLNNKLSGGSNGTGLLINIFGTGAAMTAQVEGNELNGSKVGIDIFGVAGATGAGNVDLGGGSNTFGTSKGANNFRGFDGVNGHYAIILRNTDAALTVAAQQNIFDNGVNADLVIRDQDNGGGTGVLNVSNPMDAEHAFVQSLYSKLLGRAGDTATGGEVDQWVSKLSTLGKRGVAKAILFSDESLARLVNDLYASYLDRDATGAELTKFTKQLKTGKSITAIEAKILGSVEFQRHINTDFVQALYLQVLERPATLAELTTKYNSLPTLGLRGVAASITGSQERRTNAATDFYHELLHRDPTGTEAVDLAKKPGNLLKLELRLLGGDDYFDHG